MPVHAWHSIDSKELRSTNTRSAELLHVRAPVFSLTVLGYCSCVWQLLSVHMEFDLDDYQ